jgi:hypothetical protein
MHVSCDDYEQSKKKQLFYLSRSIHPVPQMQNHLIKFGILDFEFIVTDHGIEKAIIEPQKELRSSKSGKALVK